ncbi:glycerate kinase [Jatrophihabitans sp. YIM 134969]
MTQTGTSGGAPPAPVPRVLVAPDKFKGTLTALQVADALAAGVRAAHPGATIRSFPVADGGEGTVDLALRHGYERVTARVTGPLGLPVEAVYARHGDDAVVEMASAAGLAQLGGPPTPHTAAVATSRGVGELVAHAVRAGARRVVVGVGGSASTDGGAGALAALGARILDGGGRVVAPGGLALSEVARLDLGPLTATLGGVEVVVACDVEAVLLGPGGAARVFAPQKGADDALVGRLVRALAHWADVAAATTGVDGRDRPGSGAAGGTAFGLGLAGATFTSGVDLLLDLAGFDDAVRSSDLVLVGEGSLDEQSLLGKGPVGVARRAARHGVPTVAVVGRTSVTADQARHAGLAAVVALTDEVGATRSLADPAGAVVDVVSRRFPAWWPSA